MKEKMVLLRDRLNDLSRRNRSIRMLKLYDKWSFDISEVNRINKEPSNLLHDLIARKAKTLVKQDVADEEALILSKKLNSLYRNVKSIEEETGLYDLYLGYPFISGSMMDGTYVRAPLFLYPVRLERVKKHGIQWHVEPITDEAPQLNRSLFLALQKLSNLHVPETIYDEAEEKADQINLKEWADWLEGYSLKADYGSQDELLKVQSYNKDEIPAFDKGSFQLDNMAVLGHFPQGNSAMLKDYEDFMELIEAGNDDLGLVSELLQVGEEEGDYTTDNLPGPDTSSEEPLEEEKSKFLVLDTDASQEKIIDSLKDEKGIVVHGPPGTGKSQVIVNMIANAVANNEKVILVTQKRAALDVVYQRLDSLGLFANVALLHDEKNDRRSLYRKLNQQLASDRSYEDLEEEFYQLSEKIVKTERKLDNIATGLYEVQSHGYRAYDLYGLGKPANQQDAILSLDNVLQELNKNNLNDVLMKIFSYGNYYSRFGAEDYPLKGRKSFAELEMKDRVRIVEILKKAMEKAEQSMEHLEHFEDESITPEYSWQVNDKLEKIYSDLSTEEKKTLQKLRLWWWTSFTGKTIVEELVEGNKFNGLSSKEWPKLRQSLRILYELSNVSENMSTALNEMKGYFSKETIKEYQDQIAKGDIPLSALDKQMEYVTQDFEELRNMDRMYDESPAFMKEIIDELKEKSKDYIHKDLAAHWKDIAEQSTYTYWIDEIERKHPILTKIGTDDFSHTRDQLKECLEEKQSLSIKLLQNRKRKCFRK
ncbi:DUF4011 domain-containing protein [Virgibacillus ainsalahensis]